MASGGTVLLILVSALHGSEWSTSGTLVPLNRRLGESQSWCGQFSEDKNPLSVSGFKPQIIQSTALTIPTGVSQLLWACYTRKTEQFMHTEWLAIEITER
jgi:hypothetical protein